MNGMIDLADLPLFLAVARHGSFVAASRQTKTPPSTTSRAIGRLERALGVRLLERTSRSVVLTRAGAQLLERAGTLTEELEGVLSDVSARNEALVGLVRVSAPLSTGAGRIARALMELGAAYPKIKFDLHLSNVVVDLATGGFDVAFRAGPITDASLIARRLWEVPFTLAASRDFVRKHLRGKRTVTSERLKRLPAIATIGGSWRFRRADGSRENVTIDDRFRVNDPRVAVEAAVRGLGVVRTPVDIATERDLVMLACTAGSLEPVSMYAVTPSRHLPKRVRLAVDWITRSSP